jgi:hypothetical protein
MTTSQSRETSQATDEYGVAVFEADERGDGTTNCDSGILIQSRLFGHNAVSERPNARETLNRSTDGSVAHVVP